MMKTCPECGSTEIIPDLLVFADEALTGQHPPYVKLIEPDPAKRPFIWIAKTVEGGFRAAVCGECGYTRFYTIKHADLLKAYKQGYTSQQYVMKDLLTV
jgi:predicted nucleic-acid-binding Zn-ribbon protein